jgi:hypothetical protein
MPKMGLLFVVNEPPVAMEEELNAWYDTDHIPERMAIEGFLSAWRYVSADRERRYLALYDLSEVSVLHGPGYKAFAEGNFTPWTKRVVSRTKVTRIEAEQIYPGDAMAIPAPRHLLLRFKNCGTDGASLVVEGAKRCFAGKPGVTQLRVFEGHGEDKGDYLVIVAGTGNLASFLEPDAFSNTADALAVVETYFPYEP